MPVWMVCCFCDTFVPIQVRSTPPPLSLPGVLTITEAQTEDSGVYVCSASGVEGSYSLSITDPPSENNTSQIHVYIYTHTLFLKVL